LSKQGREFSPLSLKNWRDEEKQFNSSRRNDEMSAHLSSRTAMAQIIVYNRFLSFSRYHVLVAIITESAGMD
jgi:hypothetical protein